MKLWHTDLLNWMPTHPQAVFTLLLRETGETQTKSKNVSLFDFVNDSFPSNAAESLDVNLPLSDDACRSSAISRQCGGVIPPSKRVAVPVWIHNRDFQLRQSQCARLVWPGLCLILELSFPRAKMGKTVLVVERTACQIFNMSKSQYFESRKRHALEESLFPWMHSLLWVSYSMFLVTIVLWWVLWGINKFLPKNTPSCKIAPINIL